MSDKKTEIIVALDHKKLDDALELVDQLGGLIDWYKIGSVLFTQEGPDAVRKVKERGKKIFLDLKFHDIPNTVSGAVEQCISLGVDMFTLHASGGSKMISGAVETAERIAKQKGVTAPKAIAVTVLTSFSQDDIETDFGISAHPEEIVKKLVGVVTASNGKGVVASPHELAMIRKEFGQDLIVITPGVRPAWSGSGDQQRIMTPAQASQLGADFIVIGRPIIAADDPVIAAQKILDEISEVIHG
ncbi:MAG: orotidine-5'-phosphate decarboxylase [Candidatus Auribacterota bacterium]